MSQWEVEWSPQADPGRRMQLKGQGKGRQASLQVKMGGEKRVEARRPAPKKGGPGLEACQGCKQTLGEAQEGKKLGEAQKGRQQGEEGGCRQKGKGN